MKTTNMFIATGIQTKPRPRVSTFGGFVRMYTPKTALTYERYIASEYQRLGGEYYGDKPLIVYLEFAFKLPKGTPKYKLELYSQVPCIVHKDLDNLAKSVLDALNSIAYEDDRQIVKLRIEKKYTCSREGIYISIINANYPTDKELKEDYKKWQQKNS